MPHQALWLEPGSVVATYHIDSVVGRDGMGIVYRVTSLTTPQRFALKVIAPELANDPTFRQRFDREIRIAKSIRHPNIVRVREAGEHEGTPFFVMDLIEGGDLQELLVREGAMEPHRATRLLAQIASALDAGHEHGLVHRDIKPANVLLSSHGSQERAYLTVFGLAKDLDSRTDRTLTGTFVGAVDYTPPEQFLGERLDARSDIYALGCVFFQMLAGRVPFECENTAATMWAHLHDPRPSVHELRPDLNPALDAVIAKAMDATPNRRHRSAGDFARDAAAGLEGARAWNWASGSSNYAGPSRIEASGDAAPEGVGPPSPAEISPPPPVRTSPHPPAETSDVNGDTSRSSGRFQGWISNRRARIAASVVVLALAAGAVILVLGSGGQPPGTSARSAHQNRLLQGGQPPETPARSAQEGRLLQAIGNLQRTPVTKGKLPVASCTARGASVVTCAHPAYAVDTVTLRAFSSLGMLYDAYVNSVKLLSDGHRLRTNFGNCLPDRSYGEVSWNHNYRHPRGYSLQQSRSGKLWDNQAAGRLFCSFEGSQEHIVWTMNDGRMLGTVAGAPHADTWQWWRAIHHNLVVPGSPSHMGADMNDGSSMGH